MVNRERIRSKDLNVQLCMFPPFIFTLSEQNKCFSSANNLRASGNFFWVSFSQGPVTDGSFSTHLSGKSQNLIWSLIALGCNLGVIAQVSEGSNAGHSISSLTFAYSLGNTQGPVASWGQCNLSRYDVPLLGWSSKETVWNAPFSYPSTTVADTAGPGQLN